MDATWTLSELVAEVERRLAALPAPKNGQVRAVPDERTIRYYGTLGLLDKPVAMRGRTALYGGKHLAQVIAIKRMQSLGRSLAEIQALWPTLDDDTLGRMAGIAVAPAARASRAGRGDFWKSAPATPTPSPPPPASTTPPPIADTELRIVIAPGVVVTIALPDDTALTSADVRAIRAAAAPLVDELARRQWTVPHDPTTEGGDV